MYKYFFKFYKVKRKPPVKYIFSNSPGVTNFAWAEVFLIDLQDNRAGQRGFV